jgi:hypothetical protein
VDRDGLVQMSRAEETRDERLFGLCDTAKNHLAFKYRSNHATVRVIASI